MLNDTTHRYGTVSRLFHWLSAFLITWQFSKFFDRVGDGEHWLAENIASFHITVGVCFLMVVIARLLWAVTQRSHRPVNPQSHSALATLGHGVLYLQMVLMPVLGIFYMAGHGYGLKVFGWQLIARGDEVPLLVSLGELHSPLAWVLLVTILGHVAMALKHHIAGDTLLIRSMR